MAVNKHLYLVAFDIVSDKIRYRVVKILLKYGSRVQKSVFECLLNDRQYLEMKHAIDNKIDFSVDSVRYYQLCKNCESTLVISGLGCYIYDEELIII
jgi:CRISPR-associated protein Cas2